MMNSTEKRVVITFGAVLVLIVVLMVGVSFLIQPPDDAVTIPNTSTTMMAAPSPLPLPLPAPTPSTTRPAPLPLPQPKLKAQDYIVKPGDNLWTISAHFSNIPGWYPAIANASWVKNPALIFPGQVLHIPEIA